MCGIVGIISDSAVAPALYTAMKKLEYRGYDSAGIATAVNSHLEIRKGTGKLDQVEKDCGLTLLPGTLGIGHVRWATHGGVTSANSHPHSDCSGRIALVHNGIIENYLEIRDASISRHTFTSQTDTEVIAHLIEDQVSSGLTLEEAVYHVTRRLRGSYALLVISSLEPDKIVAARRESPLLVGLGPRGSLLASDPLCFLNIADRVIYIEDGETAVLTRHAVRILDSSFQEVRREPVPLDLGTPEVSPHPYPHYMLKEIMEQPLALRRALDQDSTLIMDMALDMLRARQVVLTACGTSRHAALVGRYAFSKTAGIFSEVVAGSEFPYFSDSVDKNTVVIAVSQSGETADVLQGARMARAHGARVFSLVNTPGSTLAHLSDRTLLLRCGPEIAVAATKSFISQLTVFYLLSFAMINRLEQGIQKLFPLADKIEENLKIHTSGLACLAQELQDKKDFYYIGRGINYAIAGESALKMKEVAYVHAEGMSAGELKHGTLALIEPGTPVIALCPRDYTFTETLSNVQEARARGAVIIGVSDVPDPAFDMHIPIPAVDELFYPLVSVIPLQLLAYHSALVRGFNPDRPRNLAKSVTVK